MKFLIRQPTLFSPSSSHHLKVCNVVVEDGKIINVTNKKITADHVIEAKGMWLTPGWVDMGAQFGDPGYEQREDLLSLNQAAAAGGFTEVVVLPNTNPMVQTKNVISYLLKGNPRRLVNIWPMAAATVNCEGTKLTEMIDLHQTGAVAFTDGIHPISNSDIFVKILHYIQSFDGLLVDHSYDPIINQYGQMHEGIQSIQMGLKGIPRISEEIAINKNLQLLDYAGGRLHFSKISTGKTLQLIRNARKKGLRVTCDMTAYQPLLDHSYLADFDTCYKVKPPLREQHDNNALIKGLKDTIDVLCSGHAPYEETKKKVDFETAAFGIINWQTFGAQLVDLSKEISWELLLEKITDAPRRVMGLPEVVIEEGEPANLVVFDPRQEWILNAQTNLSKSRNSPYWDKKITGSVVAVFNNGQHAIYHTKS